MMNEVNIWQIIAYRLAKTMAEKSGVKLTYEMFKAVETELRLINEQLIDKIYFGFINAKEEEEVLRAMRKLIDEHLGEPLNSGIMY